MSFSDAGSHAYNMYIHVWVLLLANEDRYKCLYKWIGEHLVNMRFTEVFYSFSCNTDFVLSNLYHACFVLQKHVLMLCTHEQFNGVHVVLHNLIIIGSASRCTRFELDVIPC